jgi:hypothetical protein
MRDRTPTRACLSGHRQAWLSNVYPISQTWWLTTVLTAPDKLRLLIPQQATFRGPRWTSGFDPTPTLSDSVVITQV